VSNPIETARLLNLPWGLWLARRYSTEVTVKMLTEIEAEVLKRRGMADAYAGAREDLEIWKKRALEAEEKLRGAGEPSDDAIQDVMVEFGRPNDDAGTMTYTGDQIVAASRELLSRYAAPQASAEQHPDDVAVDRFAAAMKAKLTKKRAEGRGGWDREEICSAGFLSALLRDLVEKGDPLDVGNLSMMLHQRGESIAPAAKVAVEPEPRTEHEYKLTLGYAALPPHLVERLDPWEQCAVEAFVKAERDKTAKLQTNLLKDPAAVHINMLRGSIAPISFDQLAHVLGDEATKKWVADRQQRGGDVKAWIDLFWQVAKELNCLPSLFVDDNGHVIKAARQARAALAAQKPPANQEAVKFAFDEWLEKTNFIQDWVQSGKLPVKYLGWHRADVMRDLIDRPAPSYNNADEAVAWISRAAHRLILDALDHGVVVRIDLEPIKPLAMGSFAMVADVRPARERA